MNQNKVKVIQSQLKRRGTSMSLADIRDALALSYGEDVEIDDEIVAATVEKLIGSAVVESSSAMTVEEKPELITTNIEKEKIVISVAQQINVSLPIEAIKQIASSIDWAIDSRSALMKELRSAIQAWADHKLAEAQKISDEIREETNQLFVDVSQTINNAIASDNELFEIKAMEMKSVVDQAVETFRTSHKEILDIFKIPA
ncbi:MAG: hypothetical protein KME54_17700 [Tolypothrix brevis GSE-NOS-MK-07-07A]|jgi:gas vesicle protein|nr:hypothetical protein [Tolypothrix brevis GSE-NOS-MK-07-07A]